MLLGRRARRHAAAGYQADEENHQKNEEQDLRDAGSGPRNSTKP